MEKYYRFAGVEVMVRIPDERMYEHDRTLKAFAVDTVTDPHRFDFEITDTLSPPSGICIVRDGGCQVYEDDAWSVRYIGSVQNSWDQGYLRAAHRNKEHRIQLKASSFPGRIGVHTVLNALGAEHLIARADGFVFHCSYIEREGRAILFTAPSGTGKSTQADLWNSLRGAEILNGDRAAVRIADGEILAEGIPFAGSSQYCKNRSLPIDAIVYLGQAPVTTIRRLRGYAAFARIWEGVSVNTWDKRDLELVSEAVQQVAQRIPLFHLTCTPDESAVTALEQALRK